MPEFNPECITYSQMNLIFNARVYYRRLTTWTRAYILSRYYGIGTTEALFERLYRESLNIGQMLEIIFGRQYSEEYSNMVSQFPIALRDLISAQLRGNTEDMNLYIDRLYQNVANRAAYLENLNPYWTEEGYIDLFNTYIRYTLEIMNAIAAGDYAKDIELYDRLAAHTNLMGDEFAQGLYFYLTSGQQTTGTPAPQEGLQCITYDEMNTIFNIRMFWFELVTWVRRYMLSRYIGIGDEEAVYERLKQVPIDYTNYLGSVFGEEIAVEHLRELNRYIELMDAFITAQMEGNVEELNRITQLLYENADRRAANITSVNPFWEEEEWRNRLYTNLKFTIESSTSLLRGDYETNINIYSRLLDLAESTSTYFAQGLFQYLNTVEETQTRDGSVTSAITY